ncbi:MAG: TetR/AcrR family transcriptional regulator [Mycobacteriaceae bacterium]
MLNPAKDINTEDNILDGAIKSFLEYGIKRSTMTGIASYAKISPATLYRRYSSKDGLLSAVIQREALRFIDTVESQVDRTNPAREQIIDCFVAFTKTLSENKLLERLLTTEPEMLLPLLTTNALPLLTAGREYLAESIVRLQTEGQLPQFNAQEVAELMARLSLSLTLTTGGVINTSCEESARKFAQEHIIALLRLPTFE